MISHIINNYGLSCLYLIKVFSDNGDIINTFKLLESKIEKTLKGVKNMKMKLDKLIDEMDTILNGRFLGSGSNVSSSNIYDECVTDFLFNNNNLDPSTKIFTVIDDIMIDECQLTLPNGIKYSDDRSNLYGILLFYTLTKNKIKIPIMFINNKVNSKNINNDISKKIANTIVKSNITINNDECISKINLCKSVSVDSSSLSNNKFHSSNCYIELSIYTCKCLSTFTINGKDIDKKHDLRFIASDIIDIKKCTSVLNCTQGHKAPLTYISNHSTLQKQISWKSVNNVAYYTLEIFEKIVQKETLNKPIKSGNRYNSIKNNTNELTFKDAYNSKNEFICMFEQKNIYQIGKDVNKLLKIKIDKDKCFHVFELLSSNCFYLVKAYNKLGEEIKCFDLLFVR